MAVASSFLLGMAPDILAFGPFVLSRFGNSECRAFPGYVHQSYDVTHSLVVWALWQERSGLPAGSSRGFSERGHFISCAIFRCTNSRFFQRRISGLSTRLCERRALGSTGMMHSELPRAGHC